MRHIFDILYRELRRLAECLVAANRNLVPSLLPTELTHEVFAKLVQEEVRRRSQGRSELADKGSTEFKRYFAAACRDVLIDRLRRRTATKRGHGKVHKELDEASLLSPDRELGMLELHDELRRLGERGSDLEQIVEMHVFGAMTIAEIAKETGLSTATVERRLRLAWALLRRWWGKQ